MMLQQKIAVVTGGAAGIGYGIAQEMAQQGAHVIIGDVEEETGRASAASLIGRGLSSEFVHLDVSSAESVKNFANQLITKHGHVDVLVNNAGVSHFQPILEMTEADWDFVMGVDLKGVFLCTKSMLPSMIKHGKGVIINVSSNHALATLPDTEVYAAAKAGVVGFTKSLGLSYGSKGIRAVAVAPGFTDTPHVQRWFAASPEPERLKTFTNQLHPANRIAKPVDIGRVVAFLASDEAEWVTSTLIVVDGGLSSTLYHELNLTTTVTQ